MIVTSAGIEERNDMVLREEDFSRPVVRDSSPQSSSAWPEWHCPVHQIAVRDQDDALVCSFGHAFKRVQGIPRFVVGAQYVASFGSQWKKYRRTQLDSYWKASISADRLRRCLGEGLWNNLLGKQVLECGCGAGRFTEILLSRGAHVMSVDLSNAVEANQKNFPVNDSHRLAQADILQLPFAPQQFDIVLCLGVVQHTPNPERTMECLYKQVKPGGTLVIDHYTHTLSWYTKTAPLFRFFFRRLGPDEGIIWTDRLVSILFPLHKLVRNFHIGQMLLSRFSPVLCYYHAHPELPDRFQREWAFLDTHDSLTSWHRKLRTRGQIYKHLRRLGLTDIHSSYGGNGVEARGRCPSPQAAAGESDGANQPAHKSSSQRHGRATAERNLEEPHE
jgi:SAM-dependent methyltransferase